MENAKHQRLPKPTSLSIHRRSSSDRSLLNEFPGQTTNHSATSLQNASSEDGNASTVIEIPTQQDTSNLIVSDHAMANDAVNSKSRLSNFALPSFFTNTSTPLAGGIFSQHRRRSSGGAVALNKKLSVDAAASDYSNAITDDQVHSPTKLKSWLRQNTGRKVKTAIEEMPLLECVNNRNELNVSPKNNPSNFDEVGPAKHAAMANSSHHLTNSTTSPAQHSFLLDAADLRQMEQELLGLLNDFNSGKLRAFLSGDTLDRMKLVREQQERLARLHFEFHATEQKQRFDTALKPAQASIGHLFEELKGLNGSIQRLCGEHSAVSQKI